MINAWAETTAPSAATNTTTTTTGAEASAAPSASGPATTTTTTTAQPVLTSTTMTTTASSGTPSAAGAPVQPNPLMSFVPFALMLGVVYLFIIRPQQKRVKEHQAKLEKLKTGDEVVTQGGIFGTIREVSDKTVTVEVDRDVKLRILKSQVNILDNAK